MVVIRARIFSGLWTMKMMMIEMVIKTMMIIKMMMMMIKGYEDVPGQ